MPTLDRPDAPDPYAILPPVPSFTLMSSDISDDQPLDRLFVHTSAGGDNLSPQLSWSGFPSDTRGFVVTCYDPDAPTGSGFWHWLLLGLPAEVTSLPRGAGGDREPVPGAYHVRTDFNEHRYDGAAPPPGDKVHRYFFAVHAVDTDKLPVDPAGPPAVAGFNLTFHTLARAVLRPTYQR
jgi:Raf kinase inhibitor-like YbhB/YbcL family protein